jgi:hypothetical protein
MNTLFPDTSVDSDGIEVPSKPPLSSQRRKKTLLWILALAICVAVSREIGIISLEYLTLNTSSRIDIKCSTTYWEDGIQRFTSKTNQKEITTTTETSKIGFDFPPGPDPEIDASITKRLADKKHIDILQLRSKISGPYSWPIFKDGKCEFSVVFGARSPVGKYFKGELTGVTDFNIKWVCSRRKLRGLLGEQIGIQILNAIESNVRD